MKTHVVIDGNAFYEVDEECMNRKKAQQKKKEEKQKDAPMKKKKRNL